VKNNDDDKDDDAEEKKEKKTSSRHDVSLVPVKEESTHAHAGKKASASLSLSSRWRGAVTSISEV